MASYETARHPPRRVTSEHVKRPLYVRGGGDLGTKAADLDAALERVFDVATAWKAIVLVDEADVFLERRSLHGLERSAMVADAVLHALRNVEYFRARHPFPHDEPRAGLRRGVALHFRELSEPSKAQVWRALLAKTGAAEVSAEQISLLAQPDENGRQIKNAVRTAHSLAVGRKVRIGFAHPAHLIADTLNAMDEFTEHWFEGMKAAVVAELSTCNFKYKKMNIMYHNLDFHMFGVSSLFWVLGAEGLLSLALCQTAHLCKKKLEYFAT
ncbi:hypothetical protein C8J57DRAFT_1471691 [Mycena rebaudengoi]|nr:hypothetical protein C8J57DRAFT_1471691 [Mycena rebaudengoi]